MKSGKDSAEAGSSNAEQAYIADIVAAQNADMQAGAHYLCVESVGAESKRGAEKDQGIRCVTSGWETHLSRSERLTLAARAWPRNKRSAGRYTGYQTNTELTADSEKRVGVGATSGCKAHTLIRRSMEAETRREEPVAQNRKYAGIVNRGRIESTAIGFGRLCLGGGTRSHHAGGCVQPASTLNASSWAAGTLKSALFDVKLPTLQREVSHGRA